MKEKISVSRVKMIFGLMALFVWALVLVSAFVVAKALRINSANRLIPIFHRGVLRCFNLCCVVEGDPAVTLPTLYICNHISYLDIFVLGAILPAVFIAKSEVAKWPLFGSLARLQDSLFIERKSRKVGSQIQQIQRHLLDVSNLILFPEGTSNLGTFVAPFNSSFFQATDSEEDNILIQPVTVAYTHYKNLPMDRNTRDFYAWYKPRKILNHFLNGLGLGRAQVKLIFHEPVKFSSFDSRKDCRGHCESVIRQGLLEAIGLDEEIMS